MVISKKSVKSSSSTKKFKKVPAKSKVPLIVDCDENLVLLVMNVVELMSQQSANPKKKQYVLQKYRRPKQLKRLRRKLLEANEEKKETEKPQQRRKSMLSDSFVRLAAALVQEPPVQFPAPHTSLSSTLTPSSPDASLSPESECTQGSQLVPSQNSQNPCTTPLDTSDGNNDQASSPSH